MKTQHREFLKLILTAAAIILAAQVLLHGEAEAQAAATTATRKLAPPHGAGKNEPMQILEIKGFLDLVTKGNDAYRAAEMNRVAAESYSYEAGLVLAPALIANMTLASDGKPSPFPIPGFNYSSVDTNSYSAGVTKLFRNGIRTTFTYSAIDTDYVGLPGAQKYFEARPQIEATIPLWRNFWGRETVGTIDAVRLGSLAKAKAQEAQAKGALIDAEAAYWRLALSREALKVSKDAVDRADALSGWTGRRVRLALSDRSESLQSTAQSKSRALDYKTSEDDERAARLAFNSARGVSGDKVPETLEVLNADLIAKWETPNRTTIRPDVEAARLQAEAAEANAKASAERSKPTFEIFGLYAFNSPHKATQSEALEASLKRDRPSTSYGLRLNMPLDFSAMKKAQAGWSAEANASRILISRRLFEQERDWNDLVSRFQLAREKIRLYEELEASQKEKLDYERTRQKSGRSTVAQVILFETDYEQTQFSRIRALADVLSLNANMKLYGVAYDAPKSASDGGAAE
ncbi:hypothetical protein BH10BDE1_BH10BDE1_11360 [soil metagenome]